MKTILFIEDESVLQKTVGDYLRKENFKMISALDGKTGLEMAKEEKPDLILLDLILPKLHGFEVLKKLKKDENIKNIPVIVLTNLESLEEVDKALELGATTYLIKSQYKLEEVVEKIKEILNKK
jgi:DNA-binding response OmpR family regulator